MEPNNACTMHSHCIEMSMEVHQVVPPPHKSTLQKLKGRLKETFFPDDPLRQFKGQPLKRKLILGAQYVFPILQWGPKYNLKLFKSDLVSGLTIASLAIPQVFSSSLSASFLSWYKKTVRILHRRQSCSSLFSPCLLVIMKMFIHISNLLLLFNYVFYHSGNKLCQACKSSSNCGTL